MMQVQRLAIEVARRFANLQKLLDLRVGDIEITGRRAATQRALADRQRKRIHHAVERNLPGSAASCSATLALALPPLLAARSFEEIGRASCRARVCKYV